VPGGVVEEGPRRSSAAGFLINFRHRWLSKPACEIYGEMAEWFKAAVLTRRQDAEADSGNAAGPEGVKGRMPGTKLP
jgi:hypothetical protein